MKLISVGLSLIVFFSIPMSALAQSATPATPPVDYWLSSLDTYAKVFGGVLTGLGTLFGLPIVALNFKKTQAEIRKLELEAASLKSNLGEGSNIAGDLEGGISVRINESQDINVQILADPRFLGPLLLLLDFIFAWIILTLAGYFFSLFGLFGLLRTLITGTISALLLIPIAQEARRVKSVLRPKEIQTGNETKP
jgi:hypothetical protein